jgi:Leucine-rich repeat (LRR) protein
LNFIPLTCPNCNGRIDYKEGKTFKCPYCDTELLLKENHVYHVDQTVNHYYGAQPEAMPKAQPQSANRAPLVVIFLLLASLGVYFTFASFSSGTKPIKANHAVRTLPQSKVLITFLQEIMRKGAAMPTEEEIAKLRYLSVSQNKDKQWQFTYSFEDPYSKPQVVKYTYVTQDKILNKERIDQKDFEAFSGLVELDLRGTYEISGDDDISFAHMAELKGYGGGFNESFRIFADYFGEKSKLVELTTQIRSNAELAMLLQFPNLRKLSITYVDESVTDFALLNQLASLDSLSLTFFDNLGWVSSLTGLKSLSIEHSEATDFSALYALTKLQELRLSFVPNLKSIDFVQNMPALQTLDLESTDLANLERLSGKSSLTKLRLGSLSKLDSVAFVNSLTSLKELRLTGYYKEETPLSLPNAGQIELPGKFLADLQAPAVTTLTVNGSDDELDAAELARFPKLARLALSDYWEFNNLRALNDIPTLQTLILNDVDFYEETAGLFRLKHVKRIECTECTLNMESGETVENTALEQLTLQKTSYNIANNAVSEIDKALPFFAGMKGLRSFTLQDSTLASVAFMEGWQAIEDLHLENNAIADLKPLAGLPKLKRLFIQGNPVQNQSVLGEGVTVYGP